MNHLSHSAGKKVRCWQWLVVISWLVVILTFAVLGFISLLALDCVLPPLAITLGQGAGWGRGQSRRQRDIKCSPPDNRQAQLCLTGSPGTWALLTTPSMKLSSLMDCPVLPPRPLLHLLLCGLACLCPQLSVIVLCSIPLHPVTTRNSACSLASPTSSLFWTTKPYQTQQMQSQSFIKHLLCVNHWIRCFYFFRYCSLQTVKCTGLTYIVQCILKFIYLFGCFGPRL